MSRSAERRAVAPRSRTSSAFLLAEIGLKHAKIASKASPANEVKIMGTEKAEEGYAGPLHQAALKQS